LNSIRKAYPSPLSFKGEGELWGSKGRSPLKLGLINDFCTRLSKRGVSPSLLFLTFDKG